MSNELYVVYEVVVNLEPIEEYKSQVDRARRVKVKRKEGYLN